MAAGGVVPLGARETNHLLPDGSNVPKLSFRGLIARKTEKKALTPQMRDMLVRLDGVYEQRPSNEPPKRGEDARAKSA